VDQLSKLTRISRIEPSLELAGLRVAPPESRSNRSIVLHALGHLGNTSRFFGLSGRSGLAARCLSVEPRLRDPRRAP
jgi:hypothetical protein